MKEQQMTEQRPSQYPSAGRPDQTTIGWAVGFTLFAAIMKIMAGIFQALQGPGGRHHPGRAQRHRQLPAYSLLPVLVAAHRGGRVCHLGDRRPWQKVGV
jgi:hypothetical protein